MLSSDSITKEIGRNTELRATMQYVSSSEWKAKSSIEELALIIWTTRNDV